LTPRATKLRRFSTWMWLAVVAGSVAGVWATSRWSSTVSIQDGPIEIRAVPVPLNPQDPSAVAIGDFHYAGGLVLTSPDSDRLHGLSDLEVTGPDRLAAVGDLGVLVEARLVLDDAGRLVGITDAHLTELTAEDGMPLVDRAEADAEGLARLPSGDYLVSFERQHRIWLYPAAGGRPRPAPAPDVSFPSNGGMEGLGTYPDAGPDAYVVGAEVAGDTWICRLSQTSCLRGPSVDKPPEFGLVAVKRLPGMRTLYLLRAFDSTRGSRSSLRIFRSSTMVARMDMALPMTIDNFEGLAAVPRDDGGIRVYLVSDDNGSPAQRTLLLAFDWAPR
jgi:hypothetical protein